MLLRYWLISICITTDLPWFVKLFLFLSSIELFNSCVLFAVAVINKSSFIIFIHFLSSFFFSSQIHLMFSYTFSSFFYFINLPVRTKYFYRTYFWINFYVMFLGCYDWISFQNILHYTEWSLRLLKWLVVRLINLCCSSFCSES